MKSRMLEIAADVLDTFAAEWVRELLDQMDEEFHYPLSWAAASSLPEDEGLHHILEKLKSISEKEWPLEVFICLHRFRSVGKAGSRQLPNLGENEILAEQRKTFLLNCTRYNG